MKAKLRLVCRKDNDLYRTLAANKVACVRCDTPEEAIDHAGEADGVLVLADGYPGKTTLMAASLFEQARRKKLRLYVEYPASLPGVEVGAPRGTQWERAVVSSDAFAPALQKLRILAIHDCRFVAMKAETPDIVMARVAGFDHAIYGLPKEIFPILSELPQPEGSGGVLVATTKLSQFLTARYAPADAWRAIWARVFAWLQPNRELPELKWTPQVRPSYGAEESVPADLEQAALRRGVDWFFNSHMLLHPDMMAQYNKPCNAPPVSTAEPDLTQDWPYGHRIARMIKNAPVGDGTLGIMEGFDSRILADGSQPVRWWNRDDCNGEIAGAMAAAGIALQNSRYREVGGNLGDWVCFRSMTSLGDRANPEHPAYGLMGWNDIPQYCGPGTMDGYAVYYGDDNARSMLGLMLAAAALKTDRYDERLLKCLFGNLRITGKLGFMPERLDQGPLEQNGWQHYFNEETSFYSPGAHAYVWACYLWAYRQTGFDLFLKRAKTGITMAMATYPQHMLWNNGTRSRMLLPLAWLLRVDDTPEHRAWLRAMAEDLAQDPCGSIRDELRKEELGAPPSSNEAYGTAEAVLMQTRDDAVCDILYTANFAFVGLHEAAMATRDAWYGQSVEKLARFFCRTQIRSETRPELDGGWFRAFDLKRWEYWASNTDAGWGAWCIETGWSQSWITAILALRHMTTSLWDITSDSRIERHLDAVRKQMLPDDVLKRNG